MRALVHIGGGKLELRQLPHVSAGERGAILKVEGSAVCIGDAETLHGYGPVMTTPLVLGHEIVGRVTEVGPEAPPSLKEFTGARVLIDDARPCGQCEWCARDQKRFCRSPRYGHIVQDALPGNWGGYAEEVTLDERSVLIPLPEDLPIGLATFAFPVASGVEWLQEGAQLRSGETVAILGTSRMGVATALVALHMGASQVVMCGDPRGVDAIKLARQIGAEVRRAPVESNSDESFDVVVVVTEAPVEYVAAAVAMAAPLGRVILACTSTSPSGIVPEMVRRKGLTLKGGRGASARSLERAVEIVVLERERMLNSDGELHRFEEAEGILSGLLDKGVARGAHVVITDRIDEGRGSDA